jgi:hypothetical protein
LRLERHKSVRQHTSLQEEYGYLKIQYNATCRQLRDLNKDFTALREVKEGMRVERDMWKRKCDEQTSQAAAQLEMALVQLRDAVDRHREDENHEKKSMEEKIRVLQKHSKILREIAQGFAVA